MKKVKKTICFDLDGVIHEYDGFKDGSMYGKPSVGSRDLLNRIMKAGYDVVICSARINPEYWEDHKEQMNKVLAWLEEYGFRKGEHYTKVSSHKPPAIFYFDDHAYRYTSMKDLKNLLF